MNQSISQQNTISAIIFDFDGVLVNSVDVVYEVHKLMRPTLTRESLEQKWNGNIDNAEFDEPKVHDIDFDKEYHERFKTLPLGDYVTHLLQQLHSKHYPMFIVSSTVNRTIQEYLERHKIGSMMTGLFGWDVAHSKVKKFRMIRDGYDVDLSRAVFITDTAGDIYEAQEAGVGTIIGITGSYQHVDYLRASEPHYVIHDLGALLPIVEQLESVSHFREKVI